MTTLSVTINDRTYGPTEVRDELSMNDYLREYLGLTGTKFGCGAAQCLSCAVIIDNKDGTSYTSPTCIVSAASFNGKSIRTVEGHAKNGELSVLQKAFIEHFAFQCGYCTAGFLNEAQVLLERLAKKRVPRADLEKTIAEALDGHLCRCTGYVKYHEAVRDVILADPQHYLLLASAVMKAELRTTTVLGITALLAMLMSTASGPPAESLATPESFDAIGDAAARSAALFTEAGKVLTHPRCVNCHPAGDRPRQGDVRRLHQPPVSRGDDGFGLPAMRCPICHQAANFGPAGVPGGPGWHLAPREMGWEGKTLAEICAQIKDPARNGGRSLDEIVHHVGEDHLVGYAWSPGANRQPAPGTQAQEGALLAAWVKTGAVCPN